MKETEPDQKITFTEKVGGDKWVTYCYICFIVTIITINDA